MSLVAVIHVTLGLLALVAGLAILPAALADERLGDTSFFAMLRRNLLRRPPDRWLRNHYFGMGWSYVGLVAATAAEIAVRLPLAGQATGGRFFAATFFASFAVVLVGGWLLLRLSRSALRPYDPPEELKPSPDTQEVLS